MACDVIYAHDRKATRSGMAFLASHYEYVSMEVNSWDILYNVLTGNENQYKNCVHRQ